MLSSHPARCFTSSKILCATMTLLGVKMKFPVLLWGMCVLFAVESVAALTPETTSSVVTTGPEKMSDQHTTAPVLKSADASVAATSGSVSTVRRDQPADEAVNTTQGSDNSMVGSTVINTAPAATSSSHVHALHTSTAVTTAAGEPNDRAGSQAATEPQKSSTAFAETNSTASSPQPTSTSKPDVATELPSANSSEKSTQTPVHALNLTSPSASTITIVTTSAPSGTTSGFVSTSKASTELTTTPQSVPATSAHMTTSRFSNATASVSADPHNSTTANSSTEVGIRVSHEPTTPPSTTAVPSKGSDETFKTSTELSSTPPSAPATSAHMTTSQFSNATASASADPHNSTTANSSTPVGILIPRKPKRLPVPTMTTTAVPGKGSNSTSTPDQPCSTRGVVKNCLIVIAVMAAVATIFMVSTIVLCTKLSARKYKVRRPKQETEMMCISSLLPDTNHSYTRQRNPVRNGILVFPAGGDSDEDVGDNLTLSSFLPENDRCV